MTFHASSNNSAKREVFKSAYLQIKQALNECNKTNFKDEHPRDSNIHYVPDNKIRRSLSGWLHYSEKKSVSKFNSPAILQNN
jgi:hypothetical protein